MQKTEIIFRRLPLVYVYKGTNPFSKTHMKDQENRLKEACTSGAVDVWNSLSLTLQSRAD